MPDAPADDVDVIVVGAGPGGLASAIYLGRFLRRVLVVDAGASRAARIPRSHNYPGFPDGVAGAALVSSLREQATRHGARMCGGIVTGIERRGEDFAVTWSGGEMLHACKLVLATGVTDIAPAMPHLADAVQQGALRYCPVCDGYEVRGQAVGLVADHGSDSFEALYLRHFTERLTVFRVSDDVRFTTPQSQALERAGVIVAPEPLRSIRVWDGRVTVAHGGSQTTVDSLYCALGMQVHSDLALALGAAHDDDGYLRVDAHRETTVPGLYAVGDVAQGLNQIAVAVGDAAIAAAAIHRALLDL